ncbi:MAG TPA: S1C family serine protease [Pseudorhodoplanes sp.]|jgi:S1-C subfamily serine protease|nr:S1C family serine protease [Pseudorhodoplanes sp.]
MRARTGLNALITQVFVLLGAVLASFPAAFAQGHPLDELLAGVVHIRTVINPDARTGANLGREREGSGIVIDDNGLVVTIGYLMVEADAAEIRTNDGRTVPANIVGYDYETGFGVLQAMLPLKVRPLPIGKSADVKEGDAVVIASFGGVAAAKPAQVVAKKEFAGSWEYLLEGAIFTSPPHPRWSGAALINREGQLVGVGSLVLSDAGGSSSPGNMFVPIDRLSPVLPDLIAQGRASSPSRPWIGITTHQIGDRLLVSQVSPAGPAERAGLKRGDIIVGVGGKKPENLADLYRKIWSRGEAGAIVPLEVEREGETRRFDVQSMDRLDHLKLHTTY